MRHALIALLVIAIIVLIATTGCDKRGPGCGAACVPNPGGSAATR